MFLQSFFVSYNAVFSEIYFSTVRTSGYRKTDCIRVNCDVYDKISRIEEGVILPFFKEEVVKVRPGSRYSYP